MTHLCSARASYRVPSWLHHLLSNPPASPRAVSHQRLHKEAAISFQSMARHQVKSNIKNHLRQPPETKGQGEVARFVYQVSKLIICREAASRHQETTSRSQKRTPASDRKPWRAVYIQESLHPGSAGTSFPSSKQHTRRQTSMCLIASLSVS